MFVSAAAEQPSTILSGFDPNYDRPAKFTRVEFEAFQLTTLSGVPATAEDVERMTPAQYCATMNALFCQRLREANALYRTGQNRGRRGATHIIDLCLHTLQRLVPDADLSGLSAICGFLLECDIMGNLPELFRPGVTAEDARSHLSIVSKEPDQS